MEVSSFPPSYESLSEETRPALGIRSKLGFQRRNTKCIGGPRRVSGRQKSMATSELTPDLSLPAKDVSFSLAVANDVCFVYPKKANDTVEADEGIEPSGTSIQKPFFLVNITFAVAKSFNSSVRQIDTLEVELKARETLAAASGFFEYNNVAVCKVQILEARDVELVPGSIHTFEAVLEVPRTTAPFDCGSWGRFEPYIHARAKLRSCDASSPPAFEEKKAHYSWIEKALSAGFSRTRTFDAKEQVCIVTVPRNDNRLNYARTHRTAVEHLGPVIVHARTDNLTVGGYLRLGLNLPTISSDVDIKDIVWTIRQETKTRSRRSEQEYAVAPQHQQILSIGQSELEQCLSRGDVAPHNTSASLLGNWLARLPNDHKLRPTTLSESTDAAIRISHKLQMQIFFNDRGEPVAGSKKGIAIFTVSWPLTIASCMCKWRSLILPSYSRKDPYPTSDAFKTILKLSTDRSQLATRWRHNDDSSASMHRFCTCGSSMQELLDDEAEANAMLGGTSSEAVLLSELGPNQRRSSRASSLLSRRSSADAVMTLSSDTSDNGTEMPDTDNLVRNDASESDDEEQERRLAAKASNEYKPTIP